MNDIECLLIVVEIVYMIFWVLNINHFGKKFKTDKNPVLRNILLTSIFFAILPIQMIDLIFLDAWSLARLPYKISLGYGLGMIFSGFGNYFFFSFALLVFGNFEKDSKTKRLIFLVIELFATIWLLVCKILNYQTLAYLGLGIHLIVALYLGLFISIDTRKLSRKVDRKAEKVSLICMSFAGVSMLISYILFLIEGFVSPQQVSVLGIAGWIFAGFVSFLMYVGYTSPNWFRKLMKTEDRL